MSEKLKTAKKRPAKPFKGGEGVQFSQTNQPSPEAKKRGWEELRKERHLTQSIIKEMIGEDGVITDTFTGFINSLIRNANNGNPKAIDVISRCIEDDIIKVAQTDSEGNDIQIIQLPHNNRDEPNTEKK